MMGAIGLRDWRPFAAYPNPICPVPPIFVP
jgi:hypothetical protein